MSEAARKPEVRTAFLVRATLSGGTGNMSRTMAILQDSAGSPAAHLCYRLESAAVGLFLCERPEEAALALREAGVKAETETAVVVRAPDRPGLVRHLIRTLEAEDIDVALLWSASVGGETVAIFRTNSNPVAEEVLRTFFDLPTPVEPPPRGIPDDQSARDLS
jgi:hypothetical protein